MTSSSRPARERPVDPTSDKGGSETGGASDPAGIVGSGVEKPTLDELELELDALMPVGRPAGLSGYLADVWRRREFALRVPLLDLKAEHRTTALGNVWHLADPILLMLVYWLVFGVVLGVAREGIDNYVAYLAAGIFPFYYSRKAISTASRALVRNENLIRSIAFPRAILPISSFVTETLAFLPGAVVMFAAILLTGETPNSRWLLAPLVFVLQAVFTQGACFAIARATYRYRDLYNTLPFMFRLLFYGSAILYNHNSYERFVSGYRHLAFDLNPFFGIVACYRWVLLGYEMSTTALVASLTWAVLALVGGLLWFWRGETTYGAV